MNSSKETKMEHQEKGAGEEMFSRKHEFYAVDLGFARLKDAYELEGQDGQGNPVTEVYHNSVLSVVKRRSEAATDLDSIASEGDLVELDDRSQWNVGMKGAYDLTGDRLSHEEDFPKTYALMGKYFEHTGNKQIDTLVTGLPVAEYMQRQQQLKQALKKLHSFKFNKRPVTINVKDVQVIPQAAGAFYDVALDENGELVDDKDYLFGNVMVYDIGGRTSDVCVMENMGYSEEYSTTVYEGMINLQKELWKLIFKSFKYQATAYELDSVLRFGYLKLGGKRVDMKELIIQAIETRWTNMRNFLTMAIDDFRRFDAILVCGGGAYHYTPYIRDLAKDVENVIIMDQPEFANARGYLKYGKLLQQV